MYLFFPLPPPPFPLPPAPFTPFEVRCFFQPPIAAMNCFPGWFDQLASSRESRILSRRSCSWRRRSPVDRVAEEPQERGKEENFSQQQQGIHLVDGVHDTGGESADGERENSVFATLTSSTLAALVLGWLRCCRPVCCKRETVY